MPADDDEIEVEGKVCTKCGAVAVTFQHKSGEWEEPYCSGDCFEIVCYWCQKESVPTVNMKSTNDESSVCINCGKANILDWDMYGGDTLFPVVDAEKTKAVFVT